jgi:hypothetical protein
MDLLVMKGGVSFVTLLLYIFTELEREKIATDGLDFYVL